MVTHAQNMTRNCKLRAESSPCIISPIEPRLDRIAGNQLWRAGGLIRRLQNLRILGRFNKTMVKIGFVKSYYTANVADIQLRVNYSCQHIAAYKRNKHIQGSAFDCSLPGHVRPAYQAGRGKKGRIIERATYNTKSPHGGWRCTQSFGKKCEGDRHRKACFIDFECNASPTRHYEGFHILGEGMFANKYLSMVFKIKKDEGFLWYNYTQEIYKCSFQ